MTVNLLFLLQTQFIRFILLSAFIPSSAFYPLRFIPSAAFYPLGCVLSPHPHLIFSSALCPLVCVLSPHPRFIPLAAFYPLIRHPYRHFVLTHKLDNSAASTLRFLFSFVILANRLKNLLDIFFCTCMSQCI